MFRACSRVAAVCKPNSDTLHDDGHRHIHARNYELVFDEIHTRLECGTANAKTVCDSINTCRNWFEDALASDSKDEAGASAQQ